MKKEWRPLRLVTLVRAQQMGWTWSGKTLQSRKGTLFQLKMRPLAVRRYRYTDRRFADAA